MTPAQFLQQLSGTAVKMLIHNVFVPLTPPGVELNGTD